LEEFTTKLALKAVDEIDLETLNSFRSIRSVSARTWTKEFGTVQHFFRFCLDNEWIYRSWAAKVAMPKKPEAGRARALHSRPGSEDHRRNERHGQRRV
jgi:site-specific recombinase XerD